MTLKKTQPAISRFLFLVGVGLFSASVPTFGMVVSRVAVQKQLDTALVVADVEVTANESQPDPDNFATFRATATVLSIVRTPGDGGWIPAAGDEITLTGLGGEIKDVGVFYSGFPRPRTGKRYRAYLNRLDSAAASRSFKIAGFESGLVPLQPTRDFSRNRTDGSNGDGAGAFLFWDPSSFPIPFYISAPSFTGHSDFPAAIEESFRTWRSFEDVTLEFVSFGCTQTTRNENDQINSVILMTKKWPFDSAAIAITRNFYIAGDSARAGMILDSDIMLNGVDHQFTTTDETDHHDVQNIVTHEAGHFIGLGHEVPSLDPDATMYAVAGPNEFNKRTLHPDDIAAVHAAYGGVGKKLAARGISCVIPDSHYGCLAVHGPWRFPWEAAWGVIYLVILLAIGRRFALAPPVE